MLLRRALTACARERTKQPLNPRSSRVGPHTPQSLFVYGNLLDPRMRQRLLGRLPEAVAATLEGYQRRRRRYYFVVEHATGRTSGLILKHLNERELALLDDYEDVPRLYRRKIVSVIDEAGSQARCWIYLPTAALTGPR